MASVGGTWRFSLAGAVAAAVALSVGELVTAFDDAGTSLVSTVGDEFIDSFAASLKDIAVALFGTNDKAALVVGIVVVALAIGAGVGRWSAERPWVGAGAFSAFGVLGAWAYARAPIASDGAGVAAAACAAASGWVALQVLIRRAGAPPGERSVDDGVADPHGSGAILASPAAVGGPSGGATRREFVAASLLFGGGAAGAAVLGRGLRASDPTAEARKAIELPVAAPTATIPSAPPFQEPGLTPYITPNDDFYRIDTALTVPRVDLESWALSITGMVARPLELSFADLLARPAVEAPVTLQCVSNQIGGDLVGTAVWQGVPLATLLDEAGPDADATQIFTRSVDGFTAGFPTSALDEDRTVLVAYAMNGEPLPPRHGYPVRLVVAGLYGYVSATKWLEEIELTRWEDADGYWVPRGWSKEGPVKTASRIDVPRSGDPVPAGDVVLAGVAWAPTRGISAVEVSVDDGPWEACELAPVASDETWVQWRRVWAAVPGDHVVRVRATDGTGEVQTDAVASPAPDGATGHHARRFRVAS